MNERDPAANYSIVKDKLGICPVYRLYDYVIPIKEFLIASHHLIVSKKPYGRGARQPAQRDGRALNLSHSQVLLRE